MIERCGYVVLYVDALEPMVEFYEADLGLPVGQRSERFVTFTGPGAPLALETGGPPPSGPRGRERNPTLVQFVVTNLDAVIERLARRGICVEAGRRRGAFGSLAFVRDPEGNRVGLLEPPR